MAQTDTEANRRGFGINSIRSSPVPISLGIRKNAVDIGALAQVILVANRGHIVLDINSISSSNTVSFGSIKIADAKVTGAAGEA